MEREASRFDELSSGLSDLAWFDAFCGLLTRERDPRVGDVCAVLGSPELDPPPARRGSLLLRPRDARFSFAFVNPDVDDAAFEWSLERIGLRGPPFSLSMADLLHRFPPPRITFNAFDEDYQVFFHPVPARYEFTALSVSTDRGDIADPGLVVDNVQFHFGDGLLERRDGFATRRTESD